MLRSVLVFYERCTVQHPIPLQWHDVTAPCYMQHLKYLIALIAFIVYSCIDQLGTQWIWPSGNAIPSTAWEITNTVQIIVFKNLLLYWYFQKQHILSSELVYQLWTTIGYSYLYPPNYDLASFM